MNRDELRNLWLDTDPALLCRMTDGKIAILIIGPTDEQVNRGDWRFGFQVHGEEDIRWRLPEAIERIGEKGLMERKE